MVGLGSVETGIAHFLPTADDDRVAVQHRYHFHQSPGRWMRWQRGLRRFSFFDVPEGAGGGGSAEGENWDVTRRGRGIQVALLNNRR